MRMTANAESVSTRARVENDFGASPRGSSFSLARAYISPESPKLETTRRLDP